MTTTAATAPTTADFDEAVAYTERMTQRTLDAARDSFAARPVSDFVRWSAESGMQAEATLRFMRAARKGGPAMLAEMLAREVGDTSSSADLVSQAAHDQTRRAALATLRSFKPFLDPAAFLAAL
jgi:hypothetical protein